MDALEQLRRVLERPDRDIDLAEAALLLAKQEYPELPVGRYLAQLDALAAAVRAQLPERGNLADTIFALNEYLFEEQGFKGNVEDYYNPLNSFLNQVMDRRRGIPITLSLLYIEVGRRLGLPLEGVAFPGHFLVKLPVQGGDVVLDPFAAGVSLTEEDLELRLEDVYGADAPRVASVASLLAAASKREILVRMLRNLKGIYFNAGELNKSLATVGQILLVAPDLAAEIRDRGRLYEGLECFSAAARDYQEYLTREPEAADADEIRTRLIRLHESSARLH